MRLPSQAVLVACSLIACAVGPLSAGSDFRGSVPDVPFAEEPSAEAPLLNGQTIPGIDGPVYALTEFGGLLIAGGLFTAAGDVSASNVAAWNGSAWEPLGSGTNGVVRALAVFEGQLMVGGEFTTAGGSPAINIAAWDGYAWEPLGEGMPGGEVRALAAYNGRLFAGGAWTPTGGQPANRIAAWDGTAWSALGSGISSGFVYALTVYGGSLIVAGSFSSAGGVTADNVARWDGAEWSSLGYAGPTTTISVSAQALTVYNGLLVVGSRCGNPDRDWGRIDTWDGSVWSEVPSSGLGPVSAVAAYGDKLIVGGWAGRTGTPFETHIAAWGDGAGWSYVGSGLNGGPAALTVFDGKLVAGGSFTVAGDYTASRIAGWDGSSWSGFPTGPRVNHWYSLGGGLPGRVNALAVYQNQIVAGGALGGAVFIFNGSQWSELGVLSAEVLALTEWDGALIAGVSFPGRVARWDGAAWQPLGSEMNGEVRALAVFDGQLVAGGTFTTAGGVAANRVAVWNGVTWAPLGSGIGGAAGTSVDAMTVHDGKLVVTGTFTTAGGIAAASIAAWDGSAWSQMGEAGGGRKALTVYGDLLVCGGWASCRKWTGTSWSGMGGFYAYHPTEYDSDPGVAYALAAFDGTVIAGGDFLYVTSSDANRIAAWDEATSKWKPMLWGMDGDVRALITFGQRLIAGGGFTRAGGNPARGVACWSPYGEVPVFITSFDARASEGGVDLSWDIAADEEVLGYKIYRSLEGAPSGEEIIITNGLIAPNMKTYRDDTALGGRSYEYTLSVVLGDGSEVQSQKVTVITVAYALALEQNHPNPFNPSTTISFTLPERAKVKLAVYDVQGKRVRTLVDAMLEEGRQERVWDGKDSRGRPAATGVYFCRLETADRKLTRKMLLLK